jgi:transposase InsO family protein
MATAKASTVSCVMNALNGEIFYSLREAQIVIEQWRIEYNTHRPHSALGYRPPAPEAFRPPDSSTFLVPNAI